LAGLYANGGVNLILSAFGDIDTPSSMGYNPFDTCTTLANFAKNNNFKGVDLDFQDD
jgi:hypothetical protein